MCSSRKSQAPVIVIHPLHKAKQGIRSSVYTSGTKNTCQKVKLFLSWFSLCFVYLNPENKVSSPNPRFLLASDSHLPVKFCSTDFFHTATLITPLSHTEILRCVRITVITVLLLTPEFHMAVL